MTGEPRSALWNSRFASGSTNVHRATWTCINHTKTILETRSRSGSLGRHLAEERRRQRKIRATDLASDTPTLCERPWRCFQQIPIASVRGRNCHACRSSWSTRAADGPGPVLQSTIHADLRHKAGAMKTGRSLKNITTKHD